MIPPIVGLPAAFYSLAKKHPALLQALGDAAASALRSKNPWQGALLTLLRKAAPHLASGIANELVKVILKG